MFLFICHIISHLTFYLSCFTSELERDGFCQNPFFECLVSEVPEEHKSREGKVLIKTFSIVVFPFSQVWPCRHLTQIISSNSNMHGHVYSFFCVFLVMVCESPSHHKLGINSPFFTQDTRALIPLYLSWFLFFWYSSCLSFWPLVSFCPYRIHSCRIRPFFLHLQYMGGTVSVFGGPVRDARIQR